MKTNIIKQIGNITPNPNRDNPSRGRVYNTEYIAPTINTCQGGNLQPFIIERKISEKDSV